MSIQSSSQCASELWPADGLESVPNCPVCGSSARELLHRDLTDKVFYCAPGKWNMFRCTPCGSAFLDPRPTEATIEVAYRTYYTHQDTPSHASLGMISKLRRRLANGYRNYRYGTSDYPASILGIFAAMLSPDGRATMDAGMRNLPRAKADSRLLDLGCGNGAFLLRAQSAGWKAFGVDLDPRAVAVARSKGLDVRLGGPETLGTMAEQFDVITMAHLIEHVHRPGELLEACFGLLKPDGFLWVETPNVDAQGHRLFEDSWRGLEAPRHLVLFGLDSIQTALTAAGFTRIDVQNYRPLCKSLFGASMAIQQDIAPYSRELPVPTRKSVKDAERCAEDDPRRREFITVKAWK